MIDEPTAPPLEAEPPRKRGNPGYEREESLAPKIRNLAKFYPPAGERLLARMVGISRKVLRTHYAAELELGRAELVASLAAQEIALAMDASATEGKNGQPAIVRGDPQARRFVLTKMGGWNNRMLVDVTVEDEGPKAVGDIDLRRLNAEQLAQYGYLSAIAAGVDPDTIVAVPI